MSGPAEKRVFKITMRVKPVGKGRPRFSRAGGFVRTHTPEATVGAEAEIRFLLSQAQAPKLEGPIYMVVKAVFAKPKSAKKRLHPVVKPDLSNVLKLIEDAANGILFNDDSQICITSAVKAYGEHDFVELVVGEI